MNTDSVIHKYILPRNRATSVEMPIKAQILSIQIQHGQAVIWAAHRKELSSQKYQQVFEIIFTGEEFEDVPYLQYVTTLQYPDGIVGHVYKDIRS